MPRYYFHVRRGRVTILDNVGSKLSDGVEAAKEAARRALNIEAIGSLKDIQNTGVIIVEDEFSTVLELPFGGSAGDVSEPVPTGTSIDDRRP
jgi:hypothetical protein